MALTDKVNLEVKRLSIGNDNEIRYLFRLTSYESTPVQLSSYRIVMFFDSFSPRTTAVQENFGKGYGTGGVTGSLVDHDPELISYLSAGSMPPRIYPYDGRYSYQIVYQYSGNAALTAVGANWYDTSLYIKNTDFKSFFHIDTGGRVQLGEQSLSRSYSYTSATSYIDNNTFVLEYNDGGVWKKVQEVINVGGQLDTQSGRYPYETVWLSAGGNAGDNRLKGFDTNRDHNILLASQDAYIQELQPTSTYGGILSGAINGQGQTNFRATRGMYEFPVESLSTEIKYGEMFMYVGTCNLTQVYQITTLSSDWNETSASWNQMNEAYVENVNGSHGIFDFTVPDVYSVQESITPKQLNNTILNSWRTGSIPNYGVGYSYPLSSEPNIYNAGSPVIYFRENSDYVLKPKIITYHEEQSIGRIVWLGTSTSGSKWEYADNWQGGQKPGPYDIALFDSNVSTCACSLETDEHIWGLSASNGYTGQFNFNDKTISATYYIFLDQFANLQHDTGKVTLLPSDKFMSLGNNSIYNLEIMGSSYVNISATEHGKIVNDFMVDSNAIIDLSGTLLIGKVMDLSGTVRGHDSNLRFVGTSAVNFGTSGVLSANTYLQRTSKTLRPGNYHKPVFVVTSSTNWDGGNKLSFENGTYNFGSTVNFVQSAVGASQLEVDLTSNPNINIEGDLTLSGVDVTFWKFGTQDIEIKDDIFINHTVTSAIPWTSQGGGLNFVSSGSQLFKGDSLTYVPKMRHTGTGELRLDSQNFIVSGFYQQNGTLNLSNQPLNVSGDFSVTNGTSSTFKNLEGSVITVNGNATFVGGANNSKLNLGGTAPHYLRVNGFLNGVSATIKNSDASGGSTGNATNSVDLGGNINWNFIGDVAPTISAGNAVPSSAASQNILLPVTIIDDNGLSAASIGVAVDDCHGISALTIHSPTCATVDIVVSADGSCEPIVSAADLGGRTATAKFGPLFRDATPPIITFLDPIPSNITSGNMLVPVKVTDAIQISANAYKFATINGTSALINSEYQISPTEVSFVVNLTQEVYEGQLIVSAADLVGNVAVSASPTRYSVDRSLPIAGPISYNPTTKVAKTISATFSATDNYKINAVPSAIIAAIDNKYPQSVTNFAQTTSSSIQFDVLVVNTGTLYISAFDAAGNVGVSHDTGYVATPPIVFGNAVPAKESSTVITVPVSAYETFTEDIGNYYARIDNNQMTISNLTSAVGQSGTWMFNVTISGTPEMIGDLIVSAGSTVPF